MSNVVLAELGSAVIGLAMVLGFVFLFLETRARNRFLRIHKRRQEMKVRRAGPRNVHRLSKDFSAC